MLLTITNHTPDARDLSFLLHKHPGRVQHFDLAFGQATVFYPQAGEECCKAVLLVEVDPVGLVRSKGARQGGWSLGQYVNDRAYAASSFLSVAISRVFGSALNAACKQRPELVERPLDLEVFVPVFPSAGGSERIAKIFEPLGYCVEAEAIPLDPRFPDWGDSRYFQLRLTCRKPLYEVLRQLFVLIPAFDRDKHYWVGPDEIEKLLAKGQGWLGAHPEKEWITARYLKYQKRLTREALARLVPEAEEETDEGVADGQAEEHDAKEPEVERRLSLHSQRLDRVTEILAERAPASVVDLGCGEGRLLLRLLDRTRIPRVTGMDVSGRALATAGERLERKLPLAKRRDRLSLIQGSLIYRDRRLEGYEAATLVEVIEHLDPARLATVERVVFSDARPQLVIVTTPNREYNTLFDGLAPGRLRHPDHRFEWTRREFQEWADRVSAEHAYTVSIEGLGEEHPEHGSPSQMALFWRRDESL